MVNSSCYVKPDPGLAEPEKLLLLSGTMANFERDYSPNGSLEAKNRKDKKSSREGIAPPPTRFLVLVVNYQVSVN